MLASSPETEAALQAAGVALLDRIGPAILITHSQASYLAWLAADLRPPLVKANVAIEPAGPPCESVVFGSGRTRPWGLTNIPLLYQPPLRRPEDLLVERQVVADSADLVPCWAQIEPAHLLPNLRDIPTLILASQASYHAMFAHCTAKWLKQAGVAQVEFTRLEDAGIDGNGHMMMLETNNLEIADLLDAWLCRNVGKS